jgi:hypothetical protein
MPPSAWQTFIALITDEAFSLNAQALLWENPRHKASAGTLWRPCGLSCNFVVEAKVWLDDRKFSSLQRTDRE